MALNKDTHVSASVLLRKETYDLVRERAKENKRSASMEMVLIIEKDLGVLKNDMEEEKEIN